MKVLHVIPSLHPRYGGPGKAVLEMSEALNRAGIQSEIATTHFKNEKFDNKIQSKIYSFRSFFGEYKYSPGLKKWLKQNISMYDIIDIHSIFCYSTKLAASISKRYNKPYIIRTIGQLYPWTLNNKSLKKQIYLSLFEMHSLKNAAAIQFTSKNEKDNIAISLNNKKFILELGVNSYRKISKKKFYDLFPEFKSKKIILFLSRIHNKKKPELLIEAANELLKTNDNLILVIAGSGKKNYIESLKKLIIKKDLKEKVIFTDYLDGIKKNSLLQHALVFVLPSCTENFGIAVIEAMEAGIPVLISENVGISEEIKKRKAGLIFKLDSNEITDCIKSIISNRKLRRTLIKNAKAMVKKNYNWTKIIRKQIKIYREILKE